MTHIVMHIAVVVLTRARPDQLVTCLTALDTLSSGDNTITYVIRYDDDDPETEAGLRLVAGLRLIPVQRQRPLTMGQAWNQCLPVMRQRIPDWDALSVMSDDVFPLTPHWDRGIANILSEHAAVSWREYNDPNNTNFPALTRQWVEAAGRIYPEWFPFWFSDTWLAQVYEFAAGHPMPLATDLVLGGRRGKTGQMRELQWWVDFWNATLGERALEADAIRKALGWPDVDNAPIWQKFRKLSQQWNVPAIEAARQTDAANEPPSERYLIAKAKAKTWVREHLFAEGLLYATIDGAAGGCAT